GASPSVQEIGGGRSQASRLLKFGDGEIEAAPVEVSEGELEVGADLIGRFEGGILPEEDWVAPHFRAGVGGQGCHHQQGGGAQGKRLALDLEAAEEIDGDQNQTEH